MSRVGRNEPCPCGSGRKAKRCCGVERGPSDESLARAFLAHAGREAAGDLYRLSDAELAKLFDGVLDLPALDLSLQIQLPELASPVLERLCQAVADDDPDAARAPFDEVLEAVDTPVERARIARAIIGLRATGRVDPELAGGRADRPREWLSGAGLGGSARGGGGPRRRGQHAGGNSARGLIGETRAPPGAVGRALDRVRATLTAIVNGNVARVSRSGRSGYAARGIGSRCTSAGSSPASARSILASRSR